MRPRVLGVLVVAMVCACQIQKPAGVVTADGTPFLDMSAERQAIDDRTDDAPNPRGEHDADRDVLGRDTGVVAFDATDVQSEGRPTDAAVEGGSDSNSFDGALVDLPPDRPPSPDLLEADVPTSDGDVLGANAGGCLPWQRSCGGRCVDTFVDARNCGGCGMACSAGTTCSRGSCVLSCAPNSILCGGVCRNIFRDDENCGACGTACRHVCNGGRRATPVAVYASEDTSVARFDDGTLRCWGRNYSGQCGDGTRDTRLVPVVVAVSGEVVDVSTASREVCACTRSGEMFCWGTSSHAGPVGTALVGPSRIPTLPFVTAVGTSTNHTCAVERDAGHVYCWGDAGGRIGDGTGTRRDMPVRVVDLDGAVDIATSSYTTCAVRIDGTVWCWGMAGEVPDGTIAMTSEFNRPRLIVGVSDAVEVSAQPMGFCVRLASGSVRCWGDISSSWGIAAPYRTVVTVPGVIDAEQMTLTMSRGCVATATGRAQCWGANGPGAIDPMGMRGDRYTSAREISGLSGVRFIATNVNHTCAVLATGDILCLGQNDVGQLGTTSAVRPARVLWR